jgi:hypothetical protein
VNLSNQYKKTATGEYVITGFKIDSPKGGKLKEDIDEEKPKEVPSTEAPKETKKEEEVAEKQKGKKKKSTRS